MRNLIIYNLTHQTEPVQAKHAESFFPKLAGLMFRKNLPKNSGLLLTEKNDSVVNSSIHMLFMRFDICVVWINSNYKVVDVKIAKKWHLAYFSKKPAQSVLELNVSREKDFLVGDQLKIENEK